MALTRSFLKGMNLTDEQVSAIIEAHTESTDALKGQRDKYKADAEKLESVQKELDSIKADGGNWKEKYDKEKADFDAYKTKITENETKVAKETAYKNLLKECGVSEKRIDAIVKVSDLTKLSLKDGALEGSESLATSIKEEWADFITTKEVKGAETPVQPNGTGAKQEPKQIPSIF